MWHLVTMIFKYPANWLKKDYQQQMKKTALGITEVADATYDSRFLG